MSAPPSIMTEPSPSLDIEKSVTVNKPTDHFTELLYTAIVFGLLGFVIFQGHVHNDALASKGMDFAYILIGALTQASRGGSKP